MERAKRQHLTATPDLLFQEKDIAKMGTNQLEISFTHIEDKLDNRLGCRAVEASMQPLNAKITPYCTQLT